MQIKTAAVTSQHFGRVNSTLDNCGHVVPVMRQGTGALGVRFGEFGLSTCSSSMQLYTLHNMFQSGSPLTFVGVIPEL